MAYSSADISGSSFVFYDNTVSERHAEKIFEVAYEEDYEELDLDLLSIAWIESRFKRNIRRGDRRRACGLWQMHARFSYPMFVRKSWANWSEDRFKTQIDKECRKLETITYGAKQTKKYITHIKSRGKHLCHYNSGVGGKCSRKYRKKFDMIREAFENAETICRF